MLKRGEFKAESVDSLREKVTVDVPNILRNVDYFYRFPKVKVASID